MDAGVWCVVVWGGMDVSDRRVFYSEQGIWGGFG